MRGGDCARSSCRRGRAVSRCGEAGILLLLWVFSPTVGLSQERRQDFPDGVCYPVNGSGFIVPVSGESRLDRIPIGPFSELFEGDSIVVEEGTISFIDFRNSQRSVFGKDSGYKIPHVVDPKAPTRWEEMKQRLRQVFRDRDGYEISASRAGELSVWPDEGVEFAPGVPIVLTWSADTTVSAVRVRTVEGQIVLPISGSHSRNREIDYPPDRMPPGPVEWSLLDSTDEPLLTGRFRILSEKEAEEKRERYRLQAANDGLTPPGLGAVLRALADRAYLW